MLTKDFYKKIDSELNAIIQRYKPTNSYLKKHYKSPNNQKSYAFLIWFLEFYTQVNGYLSYITDETGDGSCDIMIPYYNERSEIESYCIVQSKWKAESSSESHLEDTEVLKALMRFEAILNGEKRDVNPNVKNHIEDLLNHTRKNLPVKIIFLSLCKKTNSVPDEIRDFQNRHKKTSIEWIDIDKIKHDYIDKRYKKILPENPFKIFVNLEEEPITLRIARLGQNKRDLIHLEKPFESYVFLIKPKTIFELFEQHGFRLFFKNIRNPLIQSKINEIIEKTASDNAPFFWYYNNGITAITYGMDTLGTNAEQIDITGLQIINGSQTVYSIYNAYLNASVGKRKRLDEDMLITFRLIRSGSDDFNLNVTRYTNSQNPIVGRDFHANDDIQISLQNTFFDKKVWYEKREGEFREQPEDIKIVPNTLFGGAYLVFGLQDPVSIYSNTSNEDMIFIDEKENKNGLYDKIFKPTIQADDLLASYYMLDIAFSDKEGIFMLDNRPRRDSYHIVALSHTCLKKHFFLQFGSTVSVFRKIIELYEKNQTDILLKALDFSLQFWRDYIKGETSEEKLNNLEVALTSRQHFDFVLKEIETFNLDLNNVTIIRNDN